MMLFWLFIASLIFGQSIAGNCSLNEHWPRVFWINLDKNLDRKEYMKGQFDKLAILNTRVSAINPESHEFSIAKLEKPCKRNTGKDLAVIMTHLKAIKSALEFPADKSLEKYEKYAVIMEDDVKFLFDVDFQSLLQLAPADFGILQLVTSNVEAIESLWPLYKASNQIWKRTEWDNLARNKKTYLYWSAQAYVIHKDRIRAFIDDVISVDSSGRWSYKLVNSFFPKDCKRTRDRPCVLSNCLFADSYIYAGGGPTYVSTIPLFTGSKVGYESTIHQAEVSFHHAGFQAIKAIHQEIRNSSHSSPSGGLLPSYIRPLPHHCRGG